jgi:hypothetical protein
MKIGDFQERAGKLRRLPNGPHRPRPPEYPPNAVTSICVLSRGKRYDQQISQSGYRLVNRELDVLVEYLKSEVMLE